MVLAYRLPHRRICYESRVLATMLGPRKGPDARSLQLPSHGISSAVPSICATEAATLYARLSVLTTQ